MVVLNLTVRNGCFSYVPDRPVLNGIGFEVETGELMAVLGPNGAGKTTLLRCMTGMLRWKSGATMLDGTDIRTMGARTFWNRVSYVPQARNAASSYTVLEAVLLGRTGRMNLFQTPDREDVRKAEAVMERLGILGLRDSRCSRISGGELQMVLIARAIASEPELLILDEPESNLDFRNQLIVLNAMSELAAEGIACIFNTHYPAHALQRAGKALILRKDGTSVFGSTPSVVTEQNIRSAFGVDAVIGEIETPGTVLKNVIALGLAEGEAVPEKDPDSTCIAAATILLEDNAFAGGINGILHEYSDLMIGRMGMPYRKSGMYLINLMLDGKRIRIAEMTQRISMIPGVRMKTTYAEESGWHDQSGET